MTTPSLDTSDTKVWDCDLLVVGSGAGALSTAVTAAHLGLKVIVVEKDAHYGGTTAWSGGWMWVPRNPLARAAGIDEDAETLPWPIDQGIFGRILGFGNIHVSGRGISDVVLRNIKDPMAVKRAIESISNPAS